MKGTLGSGILHTQHDIKVPLFACCVSGLGFPPSERLFVTQLPGNLSRNPF